MNKVIFLFALMSGYSTIVYCQSEQFFSDTLNQRNENNQKDGYWIQYVNSKLVTVKRKKATYYRFMYYENGSEVFINRTSSSLFVKKGNVIGNKSIKNSIILMDGIYQLNYNKGQLHTEEKYNQGMPVYMREYFRNGNLSIYMDFTRKYNCQQGTYYVEFYTQDGYLINKYYTGRNDNGDIEFYDCE